MKKTALVLNAGKPGQLQSGDWIGPRKTVASTSPTVDDDITSGYEIGSRWINTTTGKEFVCMSAADGAAVWIPVPSLASDVDAQSGTDNENYMSALRTWEQIQYKISAGLNITFAPTPEGFSINSSASASQFIMWPDAPNQVGNVYKDWEDLCTTIAALPDGEIPTIIFRQSMAIPVTGMPVGGWDMRLGRWMSPVMATGAVTVTLADGVKIQNLVWIESGLAVEVSPTTHGVFSNNLLGGLNILIVALGAQLKNFGSKALIDSAGQVVMVLNGASQEIGGPPATAPFVKMNGTDVLIAIMLGDSPNTAWYDDCFVGGNSGSALFFIHGITFDAPNLPNWTGDAPVFSTAGKAKNLIYDDTLQSPASGATNVQGALDWLKTQSGGSTSSVAVYDPDISETAGNRYKTWAEVMDVVSAWGAVGGEIVVRKVGLSQTAEVPAGTYDLSNIHLKSDAKSIIPVISFSDGCTLSGFPKTIEGVILEGNNDTISSAPLYTESGTGLCILRDGSIKNSSTSTQPVISVPDTKSFSLIIDTGVSPLYKDSGGYEPLFVEGILSIDIWRIPNNSFLSTDNLFINGPSEIGTINIASYVLIPGGYTASHSFTGNLNYVKHSEDRVIQILSSGEGGSAIKSYLYGGSAGLVEVPLPITRKGFGNEPSSGSLFLALNGLEPIQDKQVIIVEGMAYIGQIIGGTVVDRVYKILARFTRNGSIASIDKDIQIVASSPSSGGPACTITAEDNGSGAVGIRVQNNSANNARIYIELEGRVNDFSGRGPIFIS